MIGTIVFTLGSAPFVMPLWMRRSIIGAAIGIVVIGGVVVGLWDEDSPSLQSGLSVDSPHIETRDVPGRPQIVITRTMSATAVEMLPISGTDKKRN